MEAEKPAVGALLQLSRLRLGAEQDQVGQAEQGHRRGPALTPPRATKAAARLGTTQQAPSARAHARVPQRLCAVPHTWCPRRPAKDGAH